MSSRARSPMLVLYALDLITKYVHKIDPSAKDKKWVVSEDNEDIINAYDDAEDPGHPKEMKKICKTYDGISSQKVSIINSFLAKHGFDIKLSDSGNKSAIAVAAVMILSMNWSVPGRKMTKNNFAYSTMSVSRGNTDILVKKNKCIGIRLNSKEGFVVNLIETKQGTIEQFEALMPELTVLDKENSTAGFPFISLNISGDISELLGTVMEGTDWYISQAKEQNKLSIDNLGAEVKSAAAIAVMRSIEAPPSFEYYIENPFAVLIYHKSIDDLIFFAYCDKDVWVKQ